MISFHQLIKLLPNFRLKGYVITGTETEMHLKLHICVDFNLDSYQFIFSDLINWHVTLLVPYDRRILVGARWEIHQTGIWRIMLTRTAHGTSLPFGIILTVRSSVHWFYFFFFTFFSAWIIIPIGLAPNVGMDKKSIICYIDDKEFVNLLTL